MDKDMIIIPPKPKEIDCWKLPSRSKSGSFHIIKLYDNGMYICSCPARTKCTRIKEIKLEENKEYQY
jgi:hypothetical protein